MQKAVIIKNNRVKKIIVCQNLDSVKLQPGERVCPIDRPLQIGDKFEGLWTRFLKAVGLK